MFLLHQIPLSGFLHGTMSSFLYYLAPSGPPLNITTRTVNSTTIQVTWVPPAPEHQNGIIILYDINVTVSETKSNFILNTSTTTLNVTGLHPHYTYTLAVTAVTIRPGPYSEPQTITTPEDCKFLFLTSENCSLLVLVTLYSSFEYHHNKTYALSITNFSDIIECSHIANA